MSVTPHDMPTYYAPSHDIDRGVDPDVLADIGHTDPYNEPTLKDIQRGRQLTEAEQAQLVRLEGYKDVLHTFGDIGRSENLQSVLAERPYLAKSVLSGVVQTSTEGLQSQSAKKVEAKEIEARQQIAYMLGLNSLVATGVVTEAQAMAINEATYSNYAGRFRGKENSNGRKNELAKVNRKIKKIDGPSDASAN